MEHVDPSRPGDASAADHAAADSELAAVLQRVQLELGQMRAAVLRWSAVKLRQTQLRAIDLFFVACLYVALLAAITTLTVVACVQLATGASQMLGRALGTPGGGAFLAGLTFAAVAVGLGLAARALLRRNVVRATQRQLRSVPDTPRASNATRSVA